MYRLRLEDDSGTHQGCVRSANEDSLAIRPRDGLWAIADGMGGHTKGQYASRTLVAHVEKAELPGDLGDACDALAEAIHNANEEILRESAALGEQMGTTVVGLIIRGDEFGVLWAGDSRAYLLRDEVLHQLTRDHTQVQEMLDRGLLSAEQAINHPMSHVLARAVGVQKDLEIDAIVDKAVVGDVFLLCSDGLHGVIDEAEIAAIIKTSGRESPDKLIEACLGKGAPDNVSVAVVRAYEPTALAYQLNQDVTP